MNQGDVLDDGQLELNSGAPGAIGDQLGGIDVMHEVPGGRSYAELSERALRVRLGDFEVPVVGLDDLIQMKLARGRPVDLADVDALTDPDAEAGA